MEPQTQQQYTSQSMYREIEHIDEALHRLKARILSVPAQRAATKNVLLRTGGILSHKYSKKDVLTWQRKIRDDWGS
ncbi:hypothetical protein HY732_03095 [Candidatus Uhrbacteria bacterium]|nr:hypothetical protein [Candidatus Uhrbacteria bacterium]